MSNRRKKSRFTKTDVNMICEMQRKIDAYETYILGILALINPRRDRKCVVIFERGTDMDGWVGEILKGIRKMREKIDDLGLDLELAKLELETYKSNADKAGE